MTMAHDRVMTLAGASGSGGWQPALLLRELTLAARDRARPVLYVHGATFPSACSIMFRFDGVSWADVLAAAGFSVWAFDFAGFGGSERHPGAAEGLGPVADPPGRASEAAAQVERAARAVLAETGAARLSIIAHSWGTMAAGRFAGLRPDLVDRLVLFGPIAQRGAPRPAPPCAPWRLVTIAEQHRRFVEDVPAGAPPVLSERHFAAWARHYLASDPGSMGRSPPAVRIPNGPGADIVAAWSGRLGYEPGLIRAPVAIIRGEWDSLATDADAAWLADALTGTAEIQDIKIPGGTHLMHLEVSRGDLYRATIGFLDAARRTS